jgi:putative membrane protein
MSDQRNILSDFTPLDPRVSFAAERTLLAWVRTGLAMMGFGFVVARFGLFLHELAATQSAPRQSSGASVWIGGVLILLGVAVNVSAALNHVRLMRRLLRGETYQPNLWSFGTLVALLLSALGLLMAAYLFTWRH